MQTGVRPDGSRPLPPMPPHAWQFSDDDAITITAPRAMLGVFTEKDGKGAKINEVMDSSAAQKAGLTKGDVITKAGEKAFAEHITALENMIKGVK